MEVLGVPCRCGLCFVDMSLEFLYFVYYVPFVLALFVCSSALTPFIVSVLLREGEEADVCLRGRYFHLARPMSCCCG